MMAQTHEHDGCDLLDLGGAFRPLFSSADAFDVATGYMQNRPFPGYMLRLAAADRRDRNWGGQPFGVWLPALIQNFRNGLAAEPRGCGR